VRFKNIHRDQLLPMKGRFMSKVSVTDDGCWLWTGALKNNGYGYFRISASLGMIAAHKAAYLILVGPIDRSYVCHSCDNRACCNPGHLWLGTPKQNQQDMARKGRVYSYAKQAPHKVKRDSAGRFVSH
jgi:hypothetical protein